MTPEIVTDNNSDSSSEEDWSSDSSSEASNTSFHVDARWREVPEDEEFSNSPYEIGLSEEEEDDIEIDDIVEAIEDN